MKTEGSFDRVLEGSWSTLENTCIFTCCHHEYLLRAKMDIKNQNIKKRV